MQTTTITIIIFAVIFLGIGVISISQAREKARLERIRRATICSDRYQRMQQLLNDLPPQYLSNELRIMIAERSLETLNELISLNNEQKYKELLEADLNYIKQLRENNPKFPNLAINTEAQAKQARDNLEALYRFIESQHKNKRLSGEIAKKYLEFIRFSICQSKADLFCNRAEAAKGKPRVAIHNYHSAIEAFKPLINHPQAAQSIQQYKASIKALEAEADQQNKALKEQNSTINEEKNDEWDSFMEKEDTWQKKNNYDD
tara:strand:- start:2386 stop:3165 length:780 start_codon:yes stop_codon:yes gene_type:complete